MLLIIFMFYLTVVSKTVLVYSFSNKCNGLIEFDIPYKDRRKYNTLFKNVIYGLLDDFSDQDFDIFDIFSNNLILALYHILKKKVPPEKYQNYWENIMADSRDNDDPDVG